MKDIRTAAKEEIAEYLNHLLGIAEENAHGDEYSPVWKGLFNMVFSDGISGVLRRRFPDFRPYDPDTSYECDVRSFIDEFDSYAKGGPGTDGGPAAEFPSFGQWSEEKDGGRG